MESDAVAGEQVVECSKNHQPYEWSPSVERATDPNKRRRWLVIPVILAQIALKKFVIDRILEDDGAVGDQYGPFEPETIAENRDVLRRRRVTISLFSPALPSHSLLWGFWQAGNPKPHSATLLQMNANSGVACLILALRAQKSMRFLTHGCRSDFNLGCAITMRPQHHMACLA